MSLSSWNMALVPKHGSRMVNAHQNDASNKCALLQDVESLSWFFMAAVAIVNYACARCCPCLTRRIPGVARARSGHGRRVSMVAHRSACEALQATQDLPSTALRAALLTSRHQSSYVLMYENHPNA